MYIYHALINALSAHISEIHVNLNMIFYTHVKHSPTKTIYIKYYYYTQTQCHKSRGEEAADGFKTVEIAKWNRVCCFVFVFPPVADP